LHVAGISHLEIALKLAIFTDYDGTITTTDTIDLMLDTYGQKDWFALSRRLDAAGATNIERMTAEFTPFNATREQVRTLLTEKVGIDETFVGFLQYARSRRWKVVVLSQGVRESMEAIFAKFGIESVECHANALTAPGSPCGIAFPEKGTVRNDGCGGLCGVCKSGHISRARSMGFKTVYIGDGITDRCPAAAADLVFAKKYLKKYLTQKGLPFVPFETFADIERELAARFGDEDEVLPDEIRAEE